MTFSVIIPVYNRTATLKSAIESVLCQSFSDYEIIVVDDGSDVAVMKSLRPYRPFIRYFRNNKNMGVSFSRNLAVKKAKGEYIAFLDSDDIWLPNKLQRSFDEMEQSGLKVCHTNEFWYRTDRFVNQGKKHKRYGGYIFEQVLDMCRISPSSAVLHRSVFEKTGLFDEQMRTCEDYDLWLRVCAYFEVSYLDEKLIVKRAVTNDQLSDNIKHIEYIRLVSLARLVKCKKIHSAYKLSAIR
ncbi:MAG: glycosyl transferase [Denitrovibrio sp.]|nr:MAG: glycosyl transferase [Denitrovibrio sp.]